MSMLKVVKPAANHGVKILDDLCQAVPTRAFGLHPDALAQRFKALGPYPMPPRLEAIAEKLKTLSLLPTIPYVGLLSIKTQAVCLYPGLHLDQRRLGLLSTAAEHHKVISVAHHPVALLLHLTVQSMKVDIRQKRTNHRSLRCAPNWRPSLHLLDDVLMQKRLDQLKHPAIAHLLLYALHQPRMSNRVEVAPTIGIHHKGVAFFKPPRHFAKRVFAAKTRAKTVTHLQKLSLKDGLQHKLQRRLYDAVFDYRYSQRAQLAAPFGNLYPPHRHRPVGSPLQRDAQFLKIHLRSDLKLLDALTVDSCRSGVALHFLPGYLKRLDSVHLIDQAKPSASFDAVTQRRQHALTPHHRGFDPRPVSAQ